jgi:hypothetical protein
MHVLSGCCSDASYSQWEWVQSTSILSKVLQVFNLQIYGQICAQGYSMHTRGDRKEPQCRADRCDDRWVAARVCSCGGYSLSDVRQLHVTNLLPAESVRRLARVAETAGGWLHAMPVTSNCNVGDEDVISSERYLLLCKTHSLRCALAGRSSVLARLWIEGAMCVYAWCAMISQSN